YVEVWPVVANNLVSAKLKRVNHSRWAPADLTPENWTAVSWKIPVLKPGRDTELTVKGPNIGQQMFVEILRERAEETLTDEKRRKRRYQESDPNVGMMETAELRHWYDPDAVLDRSR
ncbi:MAG TPA: hypothetical protein VNI35_07125, partial [Nitrospira sp.]|nr:hypothetical protein [Nitrospira sp.]